MKKALIIFLVFIITLTVCIPTFLNYRNRLQTVLFSFGTALQNHSTFAIQNHKTNNVYILQSVKREKCLSLYRRQKDGNLLRYSISDATLRISTTDENKWVTKNEINLPTTPFDIIIECKNLWAGKQTFPETIKEYADLLLSAFSTTIKDSGIIIDYIALPSVFQEIKQLLRDKQTNRALSFETTRNGFAMQYSFLPFADSATNRCVSDILSPIFKDAYKEDLSIALAESADLLCHYKVQINTGLFGQFQTLRIFDEQECIFEIRKIK